MWQAEHTWESEPKATPGTGQLKCRRPTLLNPGTTHPISTPQGCPHPAHSIQQSETSRQSLTHQGDP